MFTRRIVGMNSMYEKKERAENNDRAYKIKSGVGKMSAVHS